MGELALDGLQIMVVEDDFVVAEHLNSALRDFGATVIGPIAHLDYGD